jgi:hypothetical protein
MTSSAPQRVQPSPAPGLQTAKEALQQNGLYARVIEGT